jgi:hypothetical protein
VLRIRFSGGRQFSSPKSPTSCSAKTLAATIINSTINMKLFGPIRIKALEYWAKQTGRELYDENGNYLLTDSFDGAYECSWQDKHRGKHVNLFCSLGDWACNLTDLLKDDRFDKLDLDNEEHAVVMFRFYTRAMLVISELLTDFQDIYLHSERLKPQSSNNPIARTFYFPKETPDRVTRILNYINSTCKHKAQHIHVCNDHLPIHFENSIRRKRKLNYLSLTDIQTIGKNGILVPDLEYLIKGVVTCYRKLNSYFNRNRQKFDALCLKFS